MAKSTFGLVSGPGIVSLCKRWKPISNSSVPAARIYGSPNSHKYALHPALSISLHLQIKSNPMAPELSGVKREQLRNVATTYYDATTNSGFYME